MTVQPQTPEPTTPEPTAVAPAVQTTTQQPTQKKPRNVLGLIAMIIAIVGFVFACIPGALIMGWVLLPIAFILGLVALFMKGKGKGMAITAVILAVVGTIVGVVVFMNVVASAFDEAFSSGQTTVQPPSGNGEDSDGSDESGPSDGAAEVGTRANPVPLGSLISNDEWSVVINSVAFGATQAVLDANMFNDAPPEGSEAILINYTVTYLGEDEDGGMPAFVSVEFVTAGGVTVNGLDHMVVAPDEINTLTTLYNGGSVSGNKALVVPSEGATEGVLVVRAGMLADKVFVAVQ